MEYYVDEKVLIEKIFSAGSIPEKVKQYGNKYSIPWDYWKANKSQCFQFWDDVFKKCNFREIKVEVINTESPQTFFRFHTSESDFIEDSKRIKIELLSRKVDILSQYVNDRPDISHLQGLISTAEMMGHEEKANSLRQNLIEENAFYSDLEAEYHESVMHLDSLLGKIDHT